MSSSLNINPFKMVLHKRFHFPYKFNFKTVRICAQLNVLNYTPDNSEQSYNYKVAMK